MFRTLARPLGSPAGRILLLTGLALIAATAAWLIARSREREELLREHLRAEQVLAEAGSAAIASILEGLASDLDRLSRVRSVRYLEDPQRLRRTLDSYLERAAVPVLAVVRVDTMGRILFSYPEDAVLTDALDSLAARGYFSAAGRSADRLVGGPVPGPGGGDLVGLSDRVQPDRSPPLGAVVALFPVSFIADPVKGFGEFPGRAVRIVDHGGGVIYGERSDGGSAASPFLTEAAVDADVEPRLTVEVSSTPEAALAPHAESLNAQLVLLLLLNALIAALGFFLARELALRERLERSREGRRQLEERLHQSAKMESIGTLAGGIAHDFNNILTVIQGSARLLEEQLSADGPAPEDLTAILQASDHAAELTRQLLAFARGQNLHPELTNVNELVTRTEPMLRRMLSADVIVTTDLKSRQPWILIDPVHLEQVIFNLSSNARDAMPEGGDLRLSTEDAEGPAEGLQSGRYVRLIMRDSGPGIPDEAVPHIFEPFFTTKERGRGTGLGLATVYGIIQQSGGQIGVETAPGQGTAFTLEFPAADPPAHVLAAERPATTSQEDADRSLPAATILLVDDNDAVRRVAERSLSRQGYRLICAGSGEDALRVVADPSVRIDLLITDVVMPGMTGRELADRFAAGRPDTAILFISGYNGNDVGRRGVVMDRGSFLAKPFTPVELLRAVEAALAESTNVAGS